MWFRRDLRLIDHPALSDAIANSEAIIPLFILDENLIKHAGSKRLAYLANSLRALDESLGNKLHIRVGDQVAVLQDLMKNIMSLVFTFQRNSNHMESPAIRELPKRGFHSSRWEVRMQYHRVEFANLTELIIGCTHLLQRVGCTRLAQTNRSP